MPLVFFWICDYPAYTFEVVVLAAGAVLESMAEPFLVDALLHDNFRSRAGGEGAAIFTRTVFIFAWVALGVGSLPRAFAFASVVYSLVWLGWFVRSPTAFAAATPSRLQDGKFCISTHRSLLWVFSGQAVLKMFLDQGEKLLLVKAFDESALGVFGLVSNFGSIILRLLFAPIEEIAYASFGYGPTALVLANCLAMLLRVVVCTLFMVVSPDVQLRWQDLRPPAWLFLPMAFAGVVCWLIVPDVHGSERVPWLRIGMSLGLVGGMAVAILFFNRREVRALFEAARGAKKQA